MKTLVIGAVVAALVAAPALAQSDSSILLTPPPGLPTGPAASAPQYTPAAAPIHHARTAPRASPYEAYGAAPGFGGDGMVHMNQGRAAALQACSTMAQRYAETTWGNMDEYQYRACMAEHGQAE